MVSMRDGSDDLSNNVPLLPLPGKCSSVPSFRQLWLGFGGRVNEHSISIMFSRLLFLTTYSPKKTLVAQITTSTCRGTQLWGDNDSIIPTPIELRTSTFSLLLFISINLNPPQNDSCIQWLFLVPLKGGR